MIFPKILIKKKKIYDDKGWNRYHGKTMIDLNEYPIRTEKQLCRFIYEIKGDGKFMVLAFKKKRRGFWIFWIGEISKEGFIFHKRDNVDTEEIRSLKEEYGEETDESYKIELANLISEEIKENKERKYGFYPFLKPSGRRGEFCYWEDG